MTTDFRLVTLDCPRCGAPLAGEDEDLVFYCTACRSGFRVPEEGGTAEEVDAAEEADAAGEGAPGKGRRGDEDLIPVDVSFLATPAQAPDLYLPFWVLPARIEILQRRGTGGFVQRFLGFGGSDADGADAEGSFAVPAFRASVGSAVQLALRYTFSRPATGELPRERLLGGDQTVADARKLAEFVLIAHEVQKPDTLLELDYRVEFGPPRLLGVPFRQQLDLKRDLFFDLVV